MPAILLTHAKGASIATLDSTKSPVGIKTSNPLPIPSRFPASSTPQTAVSPSGHVYLWCPEVNVVWEYDSKARRVGELVIKNGPIKRVLGAGKVEGKETAVVETEHGLDIWAKGSTGKWESSKKLEAPQDTVALSASSDFRFLAALGSEELLIYDIQVGSRESIFLGKDLYREPAIAMAFAQTTSSWLIVASAYAVLQISCEKGDRQVREINAGSESGKIMAVCTDSGRSGRCAVSRQGGRISVCGVESPDGFARTVNCSEDLIDIALMSPNQAIGRTATGYVYIQDIQHSSSSPVRLVADHSVTALQVLPMSSTPSVSANAVRRSASAAVLGDSRNAGNVQARLRTSHIGRDLEGKAETVKNVRVVSAPPQSHTVPAPRAISSRSTSQPIIRQPRPSSSMAHLPAIQDEEEEEDVVRAPTPSHHAGEQSIDLTWALRATQTAANHEFAQPSMDVNSVEELRREISNLRLDMLRMARGLKNEIRNAIKPLVDELKDSRETNERQRLEIERLRRGF